MTHMVISQTWLRAGEEHLEGYLALVDSFDNFLRSQPGFVKRQLVRSIEQPNHLIHLREFETVADYEAMTQVPEYRDQIAALSAHVDPSAYPEGAVAREYGEVVFRSE